MEKNKPFCVAPFVNLYYKGSLTYDRVSPCCEGRFEEEKSQCSYDEAWHGEKFTDIRAAMLRGEAHDICTRCIDIENAGGFNAREHYARIARRWEKTRGEAIEYSVETGNQYDKPIALDYRGSNLCNLKCRMCHPGSSSQIADEILKNADDYKDVGYETGKSNLFQRGAINTWINGVPTDNLVGFKILGGEPLLMEEVFDTLDRLAEEPNAKDVIISITSNGTRFPPQLERYTEKFDRVVIRLSLDGVDDVQEYIRTNGNWPKLLSNCHLFAELGERRSNFGVGFSFVVQAYNFFQLPKLVEFCDEWHQRYPSLSDSFFSAVEQDWLSSAILSEEHRAPVIAELEASTSPLAEQVLRIVRDYDATRKNVDRKRFAAYTVLQDRLRGTDLVDIDPRYKEYLNAES